ncbi:MAG: hypothetical protein WC812_03330 [Candidatus Pacearchaeota archaeon]|jgi:hypothetical protein
MEKNYKFHGIYLVPIFNITPSVINLPFKEDPNYSESKNKFFSVAIPLYNTITGCAGAFLFAKGIIESQEIAGKVLEILVK